jgi:hypothetical protein
LAPGNSCTINVTFTPKATGNRDAKLNLIANDETEFVPIQGTGTLPGSNATAPLNISADAGTLQVSPGGSASMGFTVQSNSGEGTLVLALSGVLPAGVTVSFDPPTTTQPSTRVTMTVVSAGSASLGSQGNERTPLYAALFPAMGIVGLILGRNKTKAVRLRLAIVFAGLMILFMMAGCGGRATSPTSPAGDFPLNVSVTSTATGHSASASVTLKLM